MVSDFNIPNLISAGGNPFHASIVFFKWDIYCSAVECSVLCLFYPDGNLENVKPPQASLEFSRDMARELFSEGHGRQVFLELPFTRVTPEDSDMTCIHFFNKQPYNRENFHSIIKSCSMFLVGFSSLQHLLNVTFLKKKASFFILIGTI